MDCVYCIVFRLKIRNGYIILQVYRGVCSQWKEQTPLFYVFVLYFLKKVYI